MNIKERNKPTEKVRGIKSRDIEYNEYTGAKKVLGPILGLLVNLGAAPVASTAIGEKVRNGELVALYNTGATTAFFQTSNAAIGAAPTALTGICLPPNAYTIIALADGDGFWRSSSADVIIYRVVDDSFIQ